MASIGTRRSNSGGSNRGGNHNNGPASPKKKVKTSPPSFKNGRSRNQVLRVTALHPNFDVEIYWLEKREGNDGYLYGVDQVLNGSKVCTYLTDKGFYDLVPRRIQRDIKDEILVNTEGKGKGTWRKLILRYCPDNGGTTAESRAEGLQVLKRFFMDENFSDYPPKEIETKDVTPVPPAQPHSMDMFLRDREIKAIMNQDLDAAVLDHTFYEKYSDFALFCWSVATDNAFANSLGFPSVDSV